jgi:hypothetical protein
MFHTFNTEVHNDNNAKLLQEKAEIFFPTSLHKMCLSWSAYSIADVVMSQGKKVQHQRELIAPP